MLLVAVSIPACGDSFKPHCHRDEDCRPGETCNLATNQCFTDHVDAGDAGPDAGDATPDAADAGDATPCTGHSMCTEDEAPLCLSDTCQPCTNAPTECAVKDSNRPVCEGGECVECNNTTSLCSSVTEAVCNAGFCEACQTGSTDCEAAFPLLPVCLNNECVQCITSVDDCSGTTPICDTTTHACRECEAHSECDFLGGAGSGVCDWDSHTCVAPADIIYVADDLGCNDSGNCDTNQACCTIVEALTRVTPSKSTIMVAAGNYNEITIHDLDVWIIGQPGATIGPSNLNINVITVQSLLATDTTAARVEGFTVQDGSSAGIGIYCVGLPAARPITIFKGNIITANAGGGVYASNCDVTLEANDISSNPGGGVYASNCDVTLEANDISSNPGGGVYLSDTNFTVLNNMVSGNGGSTPYGGFRLSGVPPVAVFHSNTVFGNFASAGNASGVRCSDPFDITSSIVVGAVSPHLTVECTPFFSYIGGNTSTLNGNIDTVANPDPMLDTDYTLLVGSPCINTGDTVSAPIHDFDGQLRDATPDIGADEYSP